MKLSDAVRLILTTDLSNRSIGEALTLSKSTVGRYRRLVRARNETWETLQRLSPTQLRDALNLPRRGPPRKRPPDFPLIQAELQRPEVSLQLLWEEYRAERPDGALSYTQFTAQYRLYRKRLPPVMRQTHAPGERVFVDYSGRRPYYIDHATGESVPAELFVGVMGASNYLYAVCTPSQTVPDWIAAHVGMLEFFGGAPAIVVPDNLKSAVIKTGSQPTLQRVYQDWARHYGLAILPARPYRPRDKGKVENGVQVAQRWILARLRHQTFFSLDELNAAVSRLVLDLNERAFKKLEGCRRSRFVELDRPALRPLPAQPYVYAEWVGRQAVPNDYHLPVLGHFYSVPHALIGQPVESRITHTQVELFHNHVRVAAHARSPLQGAHTTDRAHQPEAHRAQADRTPARMLEWAERVGPNTLAIVQRQFDRTTPALGLPACDTLRRLGDRHGVAALESAARRAVQLRSLTATSVKSLLRTGLHATASKPINRCRPHANLRGARYYSEDRTC